jgi:hypothetical protein
MKRLISIIGTALAVSATLASLAAAASLSLRSTSLAAGNARVASCGASSLSATRSVDNTGTVTLVTVNGIPQTCAGQRLSVTLEDQTGASLGSASATIGACSGGCSLGFSNFGATVSAPSLYGYAFAVRS